MIASKHGARRTLYDSSKTAYGVEFMEHLWQRHWRGTDLPDCGCYGSGGIQRGRVWISGHRRLLVIKRAGPGRQPCSGPGKIPPRNEGSSRLRSQRRAEIRHVLLRRDPHLCRIPFQLWPRISGRPAVCPMGCRLSQIRLLQFPGKCRRHQPLPHHEHGLKSHRTGNLLCGLQLGTSWCMELDAFYWGTYVSVYRRYFWQFPFLYGNLSITVGTFMPIWSLLLQWYGHAHCGNVQWRECSDWQTLYRWRISDAVFPLVLMWSSSDDWGWYPQIIFWDAKASFESGTNQYWPGPRMSSSLPGR